MKPTLRWKSLFYTPVLMLLILCCFRSFYLCRGVLQLLVSHVPKRIAEEWLFAFIKTDRPFLCSIHF